MFLRTRNKVFPRSMIGILRNRDAGPSKNIVDLRYLSEKSINITFIDRDDDEIEVKAKVGESMLDLALDNDLDIEGACGGEIACSTCHIIFDDATFKTLPPRCEEEEDMLDLALGVCETSRLGCQVKVADNFKNIKVIIPKEGANLM